MAAAFVQAFSSSGLGSTIVLTVPGGGVSAGNLLVINIMNDTSPDTISSITDGSGGVNVYSQITSLTTVSNNRSFLWYSPITQALSASSSITITLSAADGGAAVCSEFSGLISSPLDKSAGQQEPSNTTHTSGNTATTTQADELLVGCYNAFGDTQAVTSTGGFTQGTGQSATFFSWRIAMQYLVVSSTGAYASTSTTSTATTSNSLIATFKIDTGTPLVNFRPDQTKFPKRVPADVHRLLPN